MKSIITITMLLITCMCYSQVATSTWSTGETSPAIFKTGVLSLTTLIGGYDDVISVYDTTVLFKGVDTVAHNHAYVSRSMPNGYFSGNISCLVLHDATGCPDRWLLEDIICTVCLKNCTVKERRYIKAKADPYDEVKKRLDAVKK